MFGEGQGNEGSDKCSRQTEGTAGCNEERDCESKREKERNGWQNEGQEEGRPAAGEGMGCTLRVMDACARVIESEFHSPDRFPRSRGRDEVPQDARVLEPRESAAFPGEAPGEDRRNPESVDPGTRMWNTAGEKQLMFTRHFPLKSTGEVRESLRRSGNSLDAAQWSRTQTETNRIVDPIAMFHARRCDTDLRSIGSIDSGNPWDA